MGTIKKTKVAIVGAGPSGLLLGQMLHRHGIESVIIENCSQEYCESRIRAGVIEQVARDALIEAGVGERMEREGLVHGGIYLNFDGESHHIPMSELTGGRCVTVYGQTEVSKDLFAARHASGEEIVFEAENVQVSGLEQDEPVVSYSLNGEEFELQAEIIAGCDGFHGVCRPAIPKTILKSWERVYPIGWLGIMADVEPSTDELIYARHPRGFAMHSMRSRSVSRLYLQVAADEDLDQWSDDRVWEELAIRLDSPGFHLQSGPVTEKSVTPLRSFVSGPMRYKSLFLAGDAGHIVPPTGAKGLNLAVTDVCLLADALIAHFESGSSTGLDEYSDRCLARIWRSEHFSWWMTMMMHNEPGADAFAEQLMLAQLRYVVNSEAAATTLAENYVGLPFSVEKSAVAA